MLFINTYLPRHNPLILNPREGSPAQRPSGLPINYYLGSSTCMIPIDTKKLHTSTYYRRISTI